MQIIERDIHTPSKDTFNQYFVNSARKVCSLAIESRQNFISDFCLFVWVFTAQSIKWGHVKIG